MAYYWSLQSSTAERVHESTYGILIQTLLLCVVSSPGIVTFDNVMVDPIDDTFGPLEWTAEDEAETAVAALETAALNSHTVILHRPPTFM